MVIRQSSKMTKEQCREEKIRKRSPVELRCQFFTSSLPHAESLERQAFSQYIHNIILCDERAGQLKPSNKKLSSKHSSTGSCFCLFVFHLRSMDLNQRARLPFPPLLQRCHPACGHQGSSHLSPVLAYNILSRCKLSPLTPRQPMIELYTLTFSCFPLRKSELKRLIKSRIELTLPHY